MSKRCSFYVQGGRGRKLTKVSDERRKRPSYDLFKKYSQKKALSLTRETFYPI
jgi:hypothetical protein